MVRKGKEGRRRRRFRTLPKNSSTDLQRFCSGTKGVDPYGTGGHVPPIFMKGGTSMVMFPQYFRSDVV